MRKSVVSYLREWDMRKLGSGLPRREAGARCSTQVCPRLRRGRRAMAATDQGEETQRASTREMNDLIARGGRSPVPAASFEPPVEHALPARLGKYQVERFLAHGGMGEVLLGRHPNLNQPVAIKLIKPEFAQRPSYVRRFMTEAKLASSLNHPNIVRIYDADEQEGRYFLVQEYVDGGDVQQLMKSSARGTVPVPVALKIARDIASALVVAERAGIVHRDIKPANILLTKDGTAKLADLGVAKQAETPDSDASEFHLTRPGAAVGSPIYMAPEQIQDASKVDVRTDIYALGVTIYHMLTGKVPFPGSTVRELLHQHLHQRVDDPRTVNRAIPRRVARLVRKMTAFDAGDRHQSAAALERHIERTLRPLWRRQLPYWATAAAAMLCLATGAALIRAGSRLPPSLAAVEAHFQRGEFRGARSLLESLARVQPRQGKIWYALGLCCREVQDMAGLQSASRTLAALPGGGELAAHLESLRLIDTNELGRALQVAEEWIQKAQHRLPFLYAKALVLTKRQDHSGARKVLEAARDAPALFEFQRLRAVDLLAKLFSRDGQHDRAAAVYAQALERGADAQVAPSLYTNYTVALMNAGRSAEAAEPLRLALELQPGDEMAGYLQQRLRSMSDAATAAERVGRTMELIDAVAAQVRTGERAADMWSSYPLILAFLPPESDLPPDRARLGEENLWVDTLADELRSRNRFPIVDRTALEQLLREHRLSQTDMAAPAARIQVGALLPASMLIHTTVGESARNAIRVRVVVTDVATSEQVAVIGREQTSAADREETVRALVNTLLAQIRARMPLKGRVLAVDEDGLADINLGTAHGLQPGAELAVYAAEPEPAFRRLAHRAPLALARVEAADRFGASIRQTEGTQSVASGMLVIARAESDVDGAGP